MVTPVESVAETIPAMVSFPKQEKEILRFWDEIQAFQTQLELSKDRPVFSFYDGPPFATGLPHYGHLLAGTIKDTVTRYAAMNGFYVERRFGWDCHGLPVEYEIDKKLEIKSPEDVMKLGIANYNKECRSIVMRYSKEWEETVKRTGRWIDFKNDYKTLNPEFMESVWWVFKTIYEKNQVYRGFRIMPYSTACSTPLSNFEANLNYKDVIDPAVTVAFPLKSDPSVKLLAWTTTPWTLPSNLALCVNPEFDYVKIKDHESGDIYILLEKRLDVLYKDVKKAKFTVIEKLKGSQLKGLQYEPLFKYYADRPQAFVVVTDGYVTDDSGTGIVHQAPAFGEDDMRVCVDHKVIDGETDLPCPVDASGVFVDPVTEYAGMYVKDADKAIQKDIKAMGRLVRQSQISHSYPFCWRSDTPLIYKAVPSWFVRVANITEKLLKNNKQTYWVPEFVQEKRFANWLENARDWNISRNRYWGTPIPLWVSEDMEEIVCVGSVQELKDLSGISDITDIHRDSIDHITIPSSKGKGVLRRIDEVFDCWFESGSMPYAQQHYPFENKDKFEKSFPADFIAEGIDQTRGWFYTLLVLSTHLFDKPPFKNLIVNGLVLASDGKKMSKRLKNYPDPNHVLETYGADVLRLYLINSPCVRAEPLRFKEEGVRDLIARVFLPWFNSYRFFFNQVALLKKDFGHVFQHDPEAKIISDNVMDRWILASTQSLIQFVQQEMKAYRLYTVVPRLLNLIDELTNWYIRFNRKRLKGENGLEDAILANNTLFEVLFTLAKMMASFTPFITEAMYQNLKLCLKQTEGASGDTRSIHFLSFPQVKQHYFDSDIERRVSRMQSVIELGRALREKHNISLKTPLREFVVLNTDQSYLDDVKSLESYVLEELNVRSVKFTTDESAFNVKYNLLPDHKVLGQQLKKDYPKVRVALTKLSEDAVKQFVQTKKLVVEGITLTDSDLQVVRYCDTREDDALKVNFDKEVVVFIDTTLDKTLELEGIAREIINRVQRLRKKAGLLPTDEIEYYYSIVKDENGDLSEAFTSQAAFLKKNLKQDMHASVPSAKILVQEAQEVNDSSFLLYFVK